MSKHIDYTDEPLGMGEIVRDFLPPPSELVMRDDAVKITLTLSRPSVAFLKEEAKKHQVSYQRMIRRLVDEYVQNHV